MFSDLIVRLLKPYQELFHFGGCLNFTHRWGVVFFLWRLVLTRKKELIATIGGDISKLTKNESENENEASVLCLFFLWATLATKRSPWVMMFSWPALLAPPNMTYKWLFGFCFMSALEKLPAAKKRSCPDSLSEWADFLRARVTWRLLDLAVNNVCCGLAGRCGAHLLCL